MIKNSMWFTVADVMILADCGKTKACAMMAVLREELVKKGFAMPPKGKIQKKYYCERYMLALEDCERLLGEHKNNINI